MRRLIFTAIVFAILQSHAAQTEVTEVLLPKGTYVPFFRDEGEKDQPIGSLKIDKYPVTNQKFLEFVREFPQWKRSKIKSLYSGAGYLEHWASDESFPESLGEQPVTNVSWFAARKYCENSGQRLMTTAEWEYAADARNPENLNLILAWYGKSDKKLSTVHQAAVNSFGLVGMHGLIWEWVEDFSSAIMAGDSRSSNDTSRTMFCGSGSLKAKDPLEYATFMRFAHRSSLKADSVGRSLGFRCVK